MRYRDRHEDERDGGRGRKRVRKTEREIPNTNVETLKTEQHMFWSADVERGQPDAYDNTLINKTTELKEPLRYALICLVFFPAHPAGKKPGGHMINVYICRRRERHDI